MSSFILGKTRFTSHPYVSTLIFDPIASITSILSVFFSSQGLASKTYGFEVKAPTGHKSITLADISDSIAFSKYVVICIFSPLPIAPNSSTPATSVANLIHLVQ